MNTLCTLTARVKVNGEMLAQASENVLFIQKRDQATTLSGERERAKCITDILLLSSDLSNSGWNQKLIEGLPLSSVQLGLLRRKVVTARAFSPNFLKLFHS